MTIKRWALCTLILVILVCWKQGAWAANGDKVFIKEYTYNVSDDDSKNSSREKALTQIKRILSEEVGTHIESSLDITSTTKKGVSQKYVKNEINLLSSAITKLKIIEERWNGMEYYVKASVVINVDQANRVLLEAIKAKASEKDVVRLNKILEEQNKDLDTSYEKINNLKNTMLSQEIEMQAAITVQKELDIELEGAKSRLVALQAQVDEIKINKKKIDKLIESQKANIEDIVVKAKDRMKKELLNYRRYTALACLFVIGMDYFEVTQALKDIPHRVDSDSYGSDTRVVYVANMFMVFKEDVRKSHLSKYRRNVITAFKGC